METVIDGVTYCSVKETNACEGCVGNTDWDLCASLPTGCDEGVGFIWLKKDDLRQQVEVNKAFGHQMSLFPEIEPPVSAEEEEAFQALEKKKQVGGDHYLKAGSNMQPWDIAMAWKLNGWEMNVLKYTLRHRYKNRREDIEKAIHCLEFILANYEELYGEP